MRLATWMLPGLSLVPFSSGTYELTPEGNFFSKPLVSDIDNDMNFDLESLSTGNG